MLPGASGWKGDPAVLTATGYAAAAKANGIPYRPATLFPPGDPELTALARDEGCFPFQCVVSRPLARARLPPDAARAILRWGRLGAAGSTCSTRPPGLGFSATTRSSAVGRPPSTVGSTCGISTARPAVNFVLATPAAPQLPVVVFPLRARAAPSRCRVFPGWRVPATPAVCNMECISRGLGQPPAICLAQQINSSIPSISSICRRRGRRQASRRAPAGLRGDDRRADALSPRRGSRGGVG